MNKGMWDTYGATRWRVGNTDWLTDGRRVSEDSKPWFAMPPSSSERQTKDFATHAEAIAYAQTEARHTCTACGRRMPYLEAGIDGRPFCHPEEGRDCYAETSRKLAFELGGFSQKVVFEAGKLLSTAGLSVSDFDPAKRAKQANS